MEIKWIKIRTNNKNSSLIWELWNDFYSKWHFKNLWLEWKNIYAVYHNYELDRNWKFDILDWKYDLIIWWESNNENYESIILNDWIYEKFDTNWEMPEKIIKKWTEIWSSNINRNFKTDYEVYENSEDIYNPKVTIYIWKNN